MKTISLGDINLLDVGNEIQIAGVVWSDGKERQFITQFPDANESLDNLKLLPMELDDWEKWIRQTDLLETEILQHGPQGITKAIVRKTQRQIDGRIQWAVFQRDNYTCRYCGATGIPLTVDHIDLWENGGATVQDNLLSACRKCNKVRGNMEYDKWLQSSYYQQRSRGLSDVVKENNEAIVNYLPTLRSMRRINQRSR